MGDPTTDLTAKVAVDLITEIFKAGFNNIKEAEEWLKKKNKEFDFFGRAAKKYADKFEERYNTIRIFGMNQPIPLRNIYTRVNILTKITAQQRITVRDLEQLFDLDRRNFGRIQDSKEGIAAANELKRFIVLGKPGAGKTTFLKYLALQALDGNLKETLLPIFIGLKDWADSRMTLMDYVISQFDICDFPESGAFVERILSKGHCLVLMDGFDEVSGKIDEAIRQIRDFVDKYSQNRFLLSCRIAAYNYCFERFDDVEIADFTDVQIKTFVNNWFGRGTNKAQTCWQKMHENRPIRELASIPLLLTMLCLAFDETMGFPSNRAELYKEALDALLKKWDSSRSIRRDEIYRNLSLKRKESMLSRIAATTFENNQYFMPQRTLEKHISNFIQNLPESRESTLELDSEAILKSIEAQHGIFVERAKGIYSFSHLTFQEYFTAKYIVDNEAKGTLQVLVEEHLSNDKWREVFLITAGMLEEADNFLLLIKEKADALIANTPIGDNVKTIVGIIKEESINSLLEPKSLSFASILAFVHALNEANVIARNTSPERRRTLELISRSINQLASVLVISSNTGFERALKRSFAHAHARFFAVDADEDELDLLLEYLKAINLLLHCLTTECYLAKKTRQHILDNIFVLPAKGQNT